MDQRPSRRLPRRTESSNEPLKGKNARYAREEKNLECKESPGSGLLWDLQGSFFVCYLPVMSSASFLRILILDSFQPVSLISSEGPHPQILDP